MSGALEHAKKEFYDALQKAISLQKREIPQGKVFPNTRLGKYFAACQQRENLRKSELAHNEKIGNLQREIHAIDSQLEQIDRDVKEAGSLTSMLQSKDLSDKLAAVKNQSKSEIESLNANRRDLSTRLHKLQRDKPCFLSTSINPYLTVFNHFQSGYLQESKDNFELAIATEPVKTFLLILLSKFDDVQITHGDKMVYERVGEEVLKAVFPDYTNKKTQYLQQGKDLVKTLFDAELAEYEAKNSEPEKIAA
jgi:hypothetical protein